MQLVDEPKMDLFLSVPSGKRAKAFKGGVNYATDILDKPTVTHMVEMLQVGACHVRYLCKYPCQTSIPLPSAASIASIQHEHCLFTRSKCFN